MTNDQAPMTPENALRWAEHFAHVAPHFLADVVQCEERQQPIRSFNEAFARLGVALIRLQKLSQSSEMSRTELARAELVRIAATAWQAARDLGIESRADAIGKDIPF